MLTKCFLISVKLNLLCLIHWKTATAWTKIKAECLKALSSWFSQISWNLYRYKSRLEDQIINEAIKLNKANTTQSKRIAIQNKTIIETLKSIYQTIFELQLT